MLRVPLSLSYEQRTMRTPLTWSLHMYISDLYISTLLTISFYLLSKASQLINMSAWGRRTTVSSSLLYLELFS